MESPFEYSKYVTNNNFIGRSKEVTTFSCLLREKKNILFFGPPKIGKQSIIYNTFIKLKKDNYNFCYIEYNLFNIRCVEAFFLKYVNLLFSGIAINQLEWSNYQQKFIPSAPYEITVNEEGVIKFKYKTKNLLNSVQIDELLRLPERLASETGKHIIIYFRNYQDTLLYDDPQHFYKITEDVWARHRNVSYIITGEHTNAMKEIFHLYKYYYGFAEEIELSPINEKVFAEYLIKNFLKAGKAIQQDMALYMYNVVGRNPWYAQQLASLCFDSTKGYINDIIVEQGIQRLININEFNFHYIVCTLSKHQIRFLQAIMNGISKFSSSEILEKYKLNSSANVNRIKEALVKKEIITFSGNKKGVFLDPLFELWLKRYFFIKDNFGKTMY